MAVAFDARSEGERATSGTSLTVSHTCSGSNRALYAAIVYGSGAELDLSTVTATYDGVSMDVLFTDQTAANRPTRVFRLVAPNTGTHDIVFSWSGNSFLRAVAASFTGVDQSDPDDTQTAIDGSGGGTSSSGNISSATNNMTMDVLLVTNGVTGLAVTGTGQVEVNQIVADGVGAGYLGIASSYSPGATTQTMSWGWTGFVSYRGWTWDINAATAGGTDLNVGHIGEAVVGGSTF